ncbi:2-oxo acid dehydrogenase subunit E2 [Cyclobacterium salsum]|uniref:2-oxo acid dehydrogenase subunit E2 n=1 Tax=Cyclobacterium salsum TaxID=2666329 RepID=UPI00139108E9|nr:2-oxo acid dehydrogenase subunit E2 [Cyclobacterium salsum]
MEKELKIPKISEDADEATVAELLVGEGDTIEKGQAILAVESDKANVEIPADFGGTITSIKVSEGDSVSVGDVVMTVEVKDDASDSEEDESDNDKPSKNKEESQKDSEEQLEAQASHDKDEKEPEREKKAEKTNSDASEQQTGDSHSDENEAEDAGVDKTDEDAHAAPLARKFARELGVTLSEVPISGERLTRKDVTDYVKKLIRQQEGGDSEDATNDLSLPDFSKWGETERKRFSGIRKATAKNTIQSWRHIPHVTQNDKANVSGLEEFLKKQNEKSDEKITITAIILKVVAEALEEFPDFNASLDMQNEEIVYKKYVNIGVAVDTENGLLLPVVRDIKQKSIAKLAKELSEIAEKARNGKLTADEMKGGNFTISNLGGIGGTGFTPVIFPPQVAILGISRTQTEAIYRDGSFEPERKLPLSLSYDHRIIDGANAARFLRWICESLEQPIKLMMH